MLHITCDLCGKQLQPGEDHHYVVKIEAFAAYNPNEITEADLEEDHMEALSQMLRELEENGTEAELAEPYKHFRFDLCSECHHRFLRDPLGRENNLKLHFSQN